MLTFKRFLEEDWRYKRPSLNTMTGLTAMKKGFRRTSGLNLLAKYSPNRIKQRVYQHMGIYGNPVVRAVRQLTKDKIKSPFRFIPNFGDDE